MVDSYQVREESTRFGAITDEGTGLAISHRMTAGLPDGEDDDQSKNSITYRSSIECEPDVDSRQETVEAALPNRP